MTTDKRVPWIVRLHGEQVIIRKNISQQEAYLILDSLPVGIKPHAYNSASATPMEGK